MFKNKNYDFAIIGAGPAGLQMAYYMEKTGMNYIIIEKQQHVGYTFTKFPITRKMISINKIHTGTDDPEFNLRHDWNSLLQDFDSGDNNLLMKDFSTEFYPNADDYVKYLKQFCKNYKLNIKFNTEITKVDQQKDGFHLEFNGKSKMIAKKVIFAGGLMKPHSPPNILGHTIHYSELPGRLELIEKYAGKKVIIIGDGNSGLEVAQIFENIASHTLILTKKQSIWAMSSKYVGGPRGVYLQFYDHFLLKSLSAKDSIGPKTVLSVLPDKPGGGYIVKSNCNNPRCESLMCSPLYRKGGMIGNHVDLVVNCTGWDFDNSVFTRKPMVSNDGKFPAITPEFESINCPGLYFIGALGHSHDYKLSSGGFIHGFRYSIRWTFQMFQNGITTKLFDNTDELSEYLLSRTNRSSCLYQMFGQFGDVFWFDKKSQKYIYFEDIYLMYILWPETKIVPTLDLPVGIMTLEYGDLVTDTMKFGDRTTTIGYENHAKLLHPVIRIYQGDLRTPRMVNGVNSRLLNQHPNLLEEFHLDEDLFTIFTGVERIQRLLRGIKWN